MSQPASLQTVIKHEILVSGLSNTVFNGLICWMLLRHLSHLPLVGEHGVLLDLVATAFILPLIVTLIVIPLARRKQRAGNMPGAAPRLLAGAWSGLLRIPDNLFAAAVVFGLLAMLAIIPPTIGGLYALGIEGFTPLTYALFKGVWAGVLAALLTPFLLMTVVVKEAANG